MLNASGPPGRRNLTGRVTVATQLEKCDEAILISARGVGVLRQQRWLISDLDFDIRRGEIVTLIGPNGAGKSTAAKIATGVMKPNHGSVQRARGLKVGYVPQNLAIDWTLPLTVERLLNLTQRQTTEAVSEALTMVGMAGYRKAAVQQLSGGEFQRVLLARALVRNPDLLVLDEPVQGVDFSGQVMIYQLIKQIRNATGCGVLLISHDLHVVMAETDRVLCLNGHLCCSGTPETVLADPAYIQLFGHRAAETLAIYHHHHDHTHLPDGRIAPHAHSNAVPNEIDKRELS